MIVQGNIGPIHAKDLRNIGAATETVTVNIPLPVEEGIHCPQLISEEPLVVAPETLDHAQDCAQRIIDMMDRLPHNEMSGDLLAMAFTILHYKGKNNV